MTATILSLSSKKIDVYGCMCILGLLKHLYAHLSDIHHLDLTGACLLWVIEKVVSSGCTDAATCTRSGHFFHKFDFDECQRLQAP